MNRTRKVGTITLGASLVSFGILFLTHLFTDMISYQFVMKLWPVIFIFLGLEILISCIKAKEERFTYDIAAVFIIIMLSGFAMGMAGVDFLMEHAVNHNIYF